MTINQVSKYYLGEVIDLGVMGSNIFSNTFKAKQYIYLTIVST